MTEPVVIVGCGYVGGHVAHLEQDRGSSVLGVVRSSTGAERLRGLGIEPLVADVDAGAAVPVAGARLYYFLPPPSTGREDPRLAGFLDAIDPAALPERVVLISTTGVYGDCGGAWVDESWPPRPQADRTHRRLAAERALMAWSERTGVAAVILRVPGIYGPGRLPLERLRRGEPVLREAESPWSNRVHVADLARACVAAMERGRPGGIYNVSDGHPSTMTDYFNRVADAAGLPRPPTLSLAEAQGRLSAGMRSYLAESKRLDNRRMREELGVAPLYPELSSGLANAVEEP